MFICAFQNYKIMKVESLEIGESNVYIHMGNHPKLNQDINLDERMNL